MGRLYMTRARLLAQRLHQDFLMKSRLGAYRDLLSDLRAAGYEFIAMHELAAVARGDLAPPARVCVIRNDVDSDTRTARAMFEIDQSLGIRATYYFRLATMDAVLMRRIAASGSEVGYHYEEIATHAKRAGLRSGDEVERDLPAIRRDFSINMEHFRSLMGIYPRTVASHGDFVNRRLGVPNTRLVDDAVRSRFDLVAEAYDSWLLQPVDSRISDAASPTWWSPEPPSAAAQRGPACMYILVHPRQWRAGRTANLRLTARRMVEGVVYSLRSRGSRWTDA